MTAPPDQPLSPCERQLVARLISGGEQAFAEVYAREKAAVYGFLLRLAGDPSIAADLFQNVWLKLARSAPRLHAESHLRGWLITVARREYLSFRRAQAIDISRWLTPKSKATQQAEPVVVASLDPGMRDLQKALQSLADGDREVLLVTATEDLEPEQMADVLGLTREAYRKRLSRARTRLEQLLAAQDAEQPSQNPVHGDRV